MSARLTYSDKLIRVIMPTLSQALAMALLSTMILGLSQSHGLLNKIGITEVALGTSQNQFHARFDVILRSPVAANLALMSFWASVGLIAYLLCWGGFNLLVEARNEVTLNTAYTNRGGNIRRTLPTLAMKSSAALGLFLMIALLWPGISFWVALSGEVITHTNVITCLMGLIAVAGLALQLYAVLIFFQLTFTPWYRAESFT